MDNCKEDIAAASLAQPAGTHRKEGLLSRMCSPGMILLIAGMATLFCIQALYRSQLIPLNADYARRMFLLTGDEPSYVLMAQAIAGGHGLNVKPVIDSGDYKRFYKYPVIPPDRDTWKHYFGGKWLVPVIDQSAKWKDAQKTPFTPLLPIIMASYINWTDNARWLTGLLQSLLTCVLFFVLLRYFAFSSATRLWTPVLGMVALFGGIPIGYYTTQLYPEVLGGAALLAAGMLILDGGLRALIATFPIHLLALLATPRSAPVVMTAHAFMLFDAWRKGGIHRSSLILLGSLAAWSTFLCVNLATWGTLFPPMGASFLRNFLFAGVTHESSIPAVILQITASILHGVLRMLYGKDVGLLLLCPITMWSILLALMECKNKSLRRASFLWALLFASSVCSCALYPEFRAGACPSGRFQVIPAFLCAIPILATGRQENIVFKKYHVVTLLWLFALTVSFGLLTYQHPTYWFRSYHPMLGHHFLQKYDNWLPAFEHRILIADVSKSVLWTAIFLFPMLVAVVLRLARFLTKRSS